MPDPVAVKSMFGRIAQRYDVANHLLSGGIDHWWRKRLVKAVASQSPSRVLDVATGSGDVAFALGTRFADTVEIVGMDFCEPMLVEAEKKKNSAGSRFSRIQFRVGDGMNLPAEDGSFDAVTISFGLRNMADRHRSLSEMYRVLRPSGTLFVLEFSQPQRWFRPIYFAYLRYLLPKLAGAVTGDRPAYDYLNATITEFPDHRTLAAEIRAAGFQSVKASRLTFGIVALHEAQK
jgi:demethylmenaquinone methyltransferase/2-methoxy-6-polyprenyl-1,4-benzoquinol methylase